MASFIIPIILVTLALATDEFGNVGSVGVGEDWEGEGGSENFTDFERYDELENSIPDFVDIAYVVDTQNAFCPASISCSIEMTGINFNVSTLNERWNGQLPLIPSDCCKTCACNELCMHDGTCCANALPYLPTVTESNSYRVNTCQLLQLKPKYVIDKSHLYPNSNVSVHMYTICPKQASGGGIERIAVDHEDKDKCEDFENNTSLLSVLPVFSGSGAIFKNKYCAACHGVTDQYLTSAEARIDCVSSLLKATRPVSLVDAVLKMDTCNLIYYIPDLSGTNMCEGVPISHCNVTGNWTLYDPVVEKACEAYSSTYNGIYRNMFCYMCNGNSHDGTSCDTDSNMASSASFSIQLDLAVWDNARDANESDEICDGGTVYDKLQEVCTNVYCMSPRIYQNESCINFASKIGGVGYRVSLVFVPLLSIESFTITVGLLEQFMLDMLTDINLKTILNKFNTHVMYDQDEADKTEDTKVKYFVVHFHFFCPLHAMVDTLSIDRILQMHQTVVHLYQLLEVINTFYVRLDVFDYAERSDDVSQLFHQDHICQCNVPLVKVIPTSFIPLLEVSETQVEYRDLQTTHKCPLVILNESFYNITRFTWGLSVQSVFLNRSEYLVGCEESPDEVCICKDTLDLIAAPAQNNASSYGCLSFSIVLLVLFLRNMVLCEIQRY